MVSKVENRNFFLRQPETLDALEMLAGASELVIYAGAGVSIDRTNVAWTQLVEKVFRLAHVSGTPNARTKAVEYLVESALNNSLMIPPDQLASIVVQDSIGAQTENIFLGSKLKEILYDENGWNPGLILRNVVLLAMTAAGVGRKVTIITTNYDINIERALVTRLGELSSSVPADHVAGVRRWTLDADGPSGTIEVLASGADAAPIDIVYLHGRVDESAAVEGDLVLTEHSYAATRERSTKILTELFAGEDKGVVIVGASVTDPPLVHALASTRDSAGQRYALLRAPVAARAIGSKTLPTSEAMRDALSLRGDHLGVTMLYPMAFFQVAQFFEEARAALSAALVTGATSSYRDVANKISYPQRLTTWHGDWRKRKLTKNPMHTYEQVRDGLFAAVTSFTTAEPGELLRLELWVRLDPNTKDRKLSLWATSVGPILDDSVRRREVIESGSTNASVRCLLDGRPKLTTLEELGHDDASSRWKSFYSVPVFTDVSAKLVDDEIAGMVPVGVITLASTWKLQSQTEPSVLGRLEMPALIELKQLLLGIGKEVLRPVDALS